MNYLNTHKDSVLLGSGYLYAMAADDFDKANVSVSGMTEIGYIKDSAKFTRTHDSKEIESANYGVVDTVNGKYTTTFETGVISYNAHNVANFLTGDTVVDGTNTKTTYFCEGAKSPAVALVFKGEDEDTGNSFMLVMPRCKWKGDYTLDFNNDNPVEMSYNFNCLNTTMANGKIGAGWLVETTTPAAETPAAETPAAETPATETPASNP